MFNFKCTLRLFSSYVSAVVNPDIPQSGGTAILLLHEGMPSSVDQLARYKCDFSIKKSKLASKIMPSIYNKVNYRSKFIQRVSNDHLLNIDELLNNLCAEYVKIRNEQNQYLLHDLQQLVPELGPFSCHNLDTFYGHQEENVGIFEKLKNYNTNDKNLNNSAKILKIRSWPIHPCLIEAYVSAIKNDLENFPYDIRHEVALIFCYPLPSMELSFCKLYQQQMAATCQRIMENGAFGRRENRPYVLANFSPWTSFSPFYGFFDDQKSFKNSIGRSVKNALIIPIHSIVGNDFDYEWTVKKCIFNEKFRRKIDLQYVRFLKPATHDEQFTQGLAEIVKNYLLEEEFVHYTRIL